MTSMSRSHSGHAVLCIVLAASLALAGCGDSDSTGTGGTDGTADEVELPLGANGDLTPSEEVVVWTRALTPDLPPEMRVFAASQLVALGTPDTVKSLTMAMRDPDEQVVIVAIEGLPATTDAAAIAALEDLAASGSPKVSKAAKQRLSKLQ